MIVWETAEADDMEIPSLVGLLRGFMNGKSVRVYETWAQNNPAFNKELLNIVFDHVHVCLGVRFAWLAHSTKLDSFDILWLCDIIQ